MSTSGSISTAKYSQNFSRSSGSVEVPRSRKREDHGTSRVDSLLGSSDYSVSSGTASKGVSHRETTTRRSERAPCDDRRHSATSQGLESARRSERTACDDRRHSATSHSVEGSVVGGDRRTHSYHGDAASTHSYERSSRDSTSKGCETCVKSAEQSTRRSSKPHTATTHTSARVYTSAARDGTSGAGPPSRKFGFSRPDLDRACPPSYLLSAAARERESLLVPGEGRAYHLGVQFGELHNRILTVGHAGRADFLAERFLDQQMRTLCLKSNRNFRIHSGYYRGKPVSIVSVGMGAPMIEVLVREASYITEGPLAIARLGTCTLIDPELRPGSIVVASNGSIGCYTNYAYFDGTCMENSRTQELKPYIITRPCAADPELSRLIYRHIQTQDPTCVYEGLNASAETYYSCQGREDPLFRDENGSLLDDLILCGAQTIEMETHQLLHLAARRIELMKAAAVHIGVTSRTNDHFMHPITPSQLSQQIVVAGKACLEALVDVAI